MYKLVFSYMFCTNEPHLGETGLNDVDCVIWKSATE